MNTKLKSALFAGFLLAAGSASAADVYLQAQTFNKDLTDSLGNPQSVPMWGFATCNSDFSTCELPTAPGAQINLLSTDSLTIHLNNQLGTAVSVVIPGQAEASAGAPAAAVLDGQSRARRLSLTHDTPAGGTGTYTWNTLKAGTYLYQSGTQPSIQVPMGLYGALVVNVSAGNAYSDVTYDNDAVLLFSEIDPLQNQRVAATPGTPTQACQSMDDYLTDGSPGFPCTIDYKPLYFLVNGEAAPELANLEQNVLLRLVNAGLRSHSPSIAGLEMTLVAEDGNRYPGNPLRQSEAMLPAGKTLDALVTMAAACDPGAGTCEYDGLALFDRAPKFSSENAPSGGSLATLFPGAVIPPTVAASLAVDDEYSVTEDQVSFVAPESVLANDSGLASAVLMKGPANGTVNLQASGFFDYTPNPDFSGTDSFMYSASDGSVSDSAVVTLNVSFENDAPVAADDAYVSSLGGSVAIAAPGVLANDGDIDGDTLTANTVLVSGPTNGAVTLNADGSFDYTPTDANFSGTDSFVYEATDGTVSVSATVSLTVKPASGIALNVWEAPPAGAAPTVAVTSYRWLVQEDRTFNPDPSNPPAPADRIANTQSLNFHPSYMPIVATGCMDCVQPLTEPEGTPVAAPNVPFSMAALDPTKHYYLSVLPNDAGTGEGHTIGGAQIAPGDTEVTVFVNKQPIPTSQVSVLVFNDDYPTNGVPDATEDGLGGFEITLEEAGGRYGISGGVMGQDVYGNPLKNSLIGEPDCLVGTPRAGTIVTCPDGRALIKDLPPAKYGVIATAPPGLAGNWTQTGTIEGSKVIDAWVEAGNSPLLVEFGVTTPHAFIGFVNTSGLVNPTPGPNSITGHVTLLHDPRPPTAIGSVDSNSYAALSHTRAWVGLNSDAGDGRNIKTVHADADGNFTLDGIPNGTHQLVIWDDYLDQIIAYQTVITDNSSVDVGNVGVNAWFNRIENNVYIDSNGNGIKDDGELPLTEQAINLRWRDGTVNQSFPTDLEGFVPFDQVFPFFSWQIVEVDYTRFKATGLTVTVDGGGNDPDGDGIDNFTDPKYEGLLNPQIQTEDCTPGTTVDCGSRTELGPVLTQAYQGFAGQTTVFDWGKAPYQDGENGGISGIVFYSSTRGENDPRLTAGDPWEPGIPGVKVRLYREVATAAGGTALALVEETTTDSWDEAQPTGCPGEDPSSAFATDTLAGDVTRCFDGMRNWNQARPGVFDGGYAFGATEHLAPGNYVVEVEVPPGYELYKEEDVNVGFGDTFGPGAGSGFAPVSVTLPNGMLALVIPDQAMIEAAKGFQVGIAQPPCVGDYHTVPQELSLFPGEAAPFAGAARPLCNRKRVFVADKGQAAADFHLFTSTPVAAQYTGLTLDDLTNETDTASPNFGEKWGAANTPVAIRDFNGRQLYRGYTDQYGRFSGMMPSTFSANVPIPSGYSPAMTLTCINDAGDDAIPDPLRAPRYGAACYTLQFMPGTTTYVDTPIIPTAAFAGGYNPADCADVEGTPVIRQVGGFGDANFGPLVAPGGDLVILSAGQNVAVPNPAYDGPLGTEAPTIMRDFDFGPGGRKGRVFIGDTELTVTTWSRNFIRATAPATPMTGQLVVTRGDNGISSTNAVTVTVSDTETPIRVVPGPGTPIQDAIDNAAPGDLILVKSGVYKEQPIMWKPVRLQGSGSETLINALKEPKNVSEWADKVNGLVSSGAVDLLPGQDPTFANEVGAGIFVLGKETGADSFAANPSRIDGFTIINANIGGGMVVNGWATNLEISNNNITGNSGSMHGGIRVGHTALPNVVADASGLVAPFNDHLNIHHNAITLNGAVAFDSNGGGLSLSTGSNNYTVSHNFICGNLTQGDGAGIGHLGQSDNGLIESNKILFNQSFNPDRNPSGGGILIAGEPPAVDPLTLGSGNVVIDGNLIQGNEAGSGHGAGIRTEFVNGAEIGLQPSPWKVRMTNNMVVNNVAADSGAGISLQDSINVEIINNTIANNDSTAASGLLIGTVPSVRQPAGIASGIHTQALGDALGQPNGFSSPAPESFTNNIVWHNRSFSWDGMALQPVLAQGTTGACGDGAIYWDLGVVGVTAQLDPQRSLLSSTTDYDGSAYDASNIAGDPMFLGDYCNGARSLTAPGPMGAIAAFGEGGNFLNVRWGPLTQTWPVGGSPWDYHIAAGSEAVNLGDIASAPAADFDGDDRPLPQNLTCVDSGADEIDNLGACGAEPIAALYFSTQGNANPPGVSGENADIYSWNGSAFSKVFDATSNGLPGSASVDGLNFVDATHFYLSFAGSNTNVPGIGQVQDEDVVYYNAGTWSVYFDGTAAGMTNNARDLDAISIVGDTLYFSTFGGGGNNPVPGVAGPYDNADIYSWNGSAFSRVFDATASGVPGSANVDGLKFVDATHFYLSFSSDTNIPGIGTVQDEDVVYYNAGTWTVYFDGTAAGLTNNGHDLDGLDF